jgi:hypothetical protein
LCELIPFCTMHDCVQGQYCLQQMTMRTNAQQRSTHNSLWQLLLLLQLWRHCWAGS